MTINRRTFVKQVATTAFTAGTVTALQGADKPRQQILPIIDTHQHLWDLSKFQPPWLEGAPDVLSRSYVTKDFVEATKGLNVVKTVYMEVDVDPRQQVEEAQHVIALSKSSEHPTAGAVISGRPNSEGFRDYIMQFKDSQYIKGVRQVIHVPNAKPGLCLEKQFVASVRLLGEFGMSFDLCMRPSELSDGYKLAKKCPNTRFVVDHCGNADPHAFMKKTDADAWHKPDQWRRDIGRLAEQDNVICKISGIVARAPKTEWTSEVLAPIINHCLDEFGQDRVVFGGDWPVCLLGCSYRRWVESLKEVIADRSTAAQKKLLHDNAEKFYRLS